MSTLFFSPPLNKTPAKATDGRLDTFETSAVLTVNVDTLGTGVGAAQAFTHIFMVSEGVTSYNISASGGNVIGVSVTLSTFDTGAGSDLIDSSGEDVNPVVNGKHYDLFEYTYGVNRPTAKYLTFSLVGSNIKVYQLLVLNTVLEIPEDGFSEVLFDQDLPGFEQVSARGRRSIAPPIAGDRPKHRLTLVADPIHGDRTDKVSRQISAFMAEYPNFVFALEPTRFPDLVFPAINGERNIQSQYRARWKALGRQSRFVIQEV